MRDRDLYRISLTRELLPLPDTPVTQQSTPSGKDASMFLRLLARAPFTVSQPLGLRCAAGSGTLRAPERYCPVREAGFAMTSAGVPQATT